MLKLKTENINIPVFNGIERRKYKRIERRIVIRFRVKPHMGQVAASTDWDMVAVKDFCSRGSFFNSSYNIGIGNTLNLLIRAINSLHLFGNYDTLPTWKQKMPVLFLQVPKKQ